MGGGRGQAQQVLYGESRVEAMKGVQKIIGELGVMFKRMGDIIQEQEYNVLRIDDDVTDTLSNLENAEGSLLTYLKNISSNRALILKVFGIIIFFIVFFIVFLS